LQVERDTTGRDEHEERGSFSSRRSLRPRAKQKSPHAHRVRAQLVPSGRLPADAETLALTQERKRAQRERDFTPTPLDEGPRAALLSMGLVEPVNAR
jgi:hypothetical protein